MAHPTPSPSQAMTTSSGENRAATSARPALGPYLEAVAGALATPDATPESVLRAAQAREVRRVDLFVRFASPDPRVIDASIKLAGEGAADSHPRSVEFRFDQQGAPVTLAEVERTFGAWRKGNPGTHLSDPWPVDFTPPYRVDPRVGSGRASVFVRASLSGDPRQEGVRVRRVLLDRFADDP